MATVPDKRLIESKRVMGSPVQSLVKFIDTCLLAKANPQDGSVANLLLVTLLCITPHD